MSIARNNLLENREMSLEDRRFLLAPHRASELAEQQELVAVHEDFLVIALGSPSRGHRRAPGCNGLQWIAEHIIT